MVLPPLDSTSWAPPSLSLFLLDPGLHSQVLRAKPCLALSKLKLLCNVSDFLDSTKTEHRAFQHRLGNKLVLSLALPLVKQNIIRFF